MTQISKALHKTDFKKIEQLAKAIFHEVYDTYIPADHVDFYLNTFQTSVAIQQQIESDHYHYFLLYYLDKPVGYFGLKIQDLVLVLSKLYILKSQRGKSIGHTAMKYIENFAKKHHINKIELLVNVKNKTSIDFYKSHSFEILTTVATAYDNGHQEHDYLMVKSL